jgi:hypothetical protein
MRKHTMPTLFSSASTDIQDASPSATQVYQSQLEDYELLLSFMRAEIGSISQFRQTLLKPRTFSPLDQENETGQEALQQLLKTTDYLELCKKHKVSPHYLMVTLRDGAYAYETSNRGSEKKVILPIRGHASLQVLTTRIEKSATLMGGEIRYDRLVSLPGIATFYGIAPWDPADTAAHKAATDTVEERIASYRLGLEDDFNILDLRRRPTEKDRAVIRTDLSASSDPSQVDRQKLQAQLIAGEIVDAVIKFLPQNSTSLLTYLAQDVLPSVTIEQVRATPTVYLQKILQGPEAEKLATILLSVMDWYGGETGEETSPHIRSKVVANALQIWLKTPTSEHPDGIAGFDWQSRSHWGKSYQAIWHEFETHLLSKRASSEKEAVVIARLFLGQFPTEFGVNDIPPDLAYRSSVVWVNFVNGVNLINATDPKALRRMTFQKLVNLPLQRAEAATREQLNEISLARLLPTIDWAVTQGVILQKHREDYTQSEIELALTELDKHTGALNDSITLLKEDPPQRMSMAKTVAQKFFGKHYVEQGRKVARKRQESIRWNSVPTLPGKEYDYYSLIDVLASDELDNQTRWYYTLSDGSRSTFFFSINSDRHITATFDFSPTSGIPIVRGALPDVKTEFHKSFQSHQEQQTTAYKTLISSQLASLAFSDRQAIESGELKIYSLRKETSGVEAQNETPEIILPLRARNGLILQTTYVTETRTYDGLMLKTTRITETRTYELLPRAGVIRRIENLAPKKFGAAEKTEQWRTAKSTVSVSVLRHKELPFDWDAHATGSTPKKGAVCQAIIEQLGNAFTAPPDTVATSNNVPLTLFSPRCMEISDFIATHLLFIDPKKLYTTAYGQTAFEKEKADKDKTLEIIKIFVPFWKSIEDLASGDKTRLINGAFGLFTDLASFALPVGKFASGSAKLISNAGRLTLRARLPEFASLTKELLILTLQALNPIDGIGQLLKALGTRGLKSGRFGISQVKELAGKAGHYDFTRSLPQISDGGRWRPLVSGDQLATIRGIDDVPVRNIASTGNANYRLIDPVSSKPYGPSITPHTHELSLGRSSYSPLKKADDQVFVELPEKTRAEHILEIDGRTTVLIDDVPYRLDGEELRRVDKIDDSRQWTLLPCRPRRAPGGDCRASYVTSEPAPTPPIGTVDKTKGYAPWFGDRVSEPVALSGHEGLFLAVDAKLYRIVNNQPTLFTSDLTRLGFTGGKLVPRQQIQATRQFRQGIYARLEVGGTYNGINDSHRVGAIVVQAIDDSATHVFFRVNTQEYYLSTIGKGQTPGNQLTFNRLTPDQMADGTLGAELLTVYTGSLNANNIHRIHGAEALERAMKTMEDIAIPIGTIANPPGNMKWLKVDTSPGEALMFDHSTRMIVARRPEGTVSWTRSKEAPQALRQKTAEIFDTLFLSPTIAPRDTSAALRIDNTMQKLQSLLPKNERPLNARNIAYAEVTTVSGKREVYVSVSGAQGSTTRLPLFRHLGANHVRIGDTTYINIDYSQTFPRTSLEVTAEGKLLAVPLTIKDVGKYQPTMTTRPTSLDSESKLINVIREKYPDPEELRSVDVATTMRPCESCSVVMKEFGHDGGANALQVLWT